jgi:hypothetical protein
LAIRIIVIYISFSMSSTLLLHQCGSDVREHINLLKTSRIIREKSSDRRQMQPAAKIAAFTCQLTSDTRKPSKLDTHLPLENANT